MTIHYGTDGHAYQVPDGTVFAIADDGGRIWYTDTDDAGSDFDLTTIWEIEDADVTGDDLLEHKDFDIIARHDLETGETYDD